ncbi:MAG: UDP-N-acetylmuramoyl-L-alanine--D-glutamate ligase [Proteobacteria bacterium]|nr:UDP-N-acetylmuramoyl-L-alanine--D-glutamate ligase [Pseudomonadota bacterium]MCL2307172.1 UDP-N-acetylmuramoyl-L-alanine--D-glutamate ligase [Pseudomonadota bacterium]
MKALSHRRVLVLGLGLTGFSLVRYLSRCGANVTVADTRETPPYAEHVRREWPQVSVHCGALTPTLFDGIDMIAISPGVAKDQPLIQQAVARGVELVGDIELFARALPKGQKVLAITGTNGKTTTTALTRVLCEAAGLTAVAAGNIGDAALDVLEKIERSGVWPEVFVLELSSYQLETTTTLSPTAATVLNVSENHLDRYPDVDAYAAAKAMIFRRARQQVLNADDARVAAMRAAGLPTQWFGRNAPADVVTSWRLAEHRGETWLMRGTMPLLPTSALALAGSHNAMNALAALALTSCAVTMDEMVLETVLAVLTSFRGLQHRMEEITVMDGVRYINDSKATTVAATQAALDGMHSPVILIAGGDGKGQDFAPLAATAARYCRTVLLIGRDAPQIETALANQGAAFEHCGTLAAAVTRARALAQTGDVVLLSPACASLDQFSDYTARGLAFGEAVRTMGGTR